MKRFLALLIVAVLFLPAACFAAEYDLSAMTDEELTALASAIATEQRSRSQSATGYIVSGELGAYFVGLKSVAFDEDSQGNKVVVLTMDFSHTKDEAKSFGFSINPEVFQNGIECEPSYFYDNANAMTEIKSGVTLEVKKAYIITDVTPLDIDIGESLNFKKEYLKTTYNVQ